MRTRGVGGFGLCDGVPGGVSPAREVPLVGLEDALVLYANVGCAVRGGGAVGTCEEGGSLCGDEGERVLDLLPAGVVFCESVGVCESAGGVSGCPRGREGGDGVPRVDAVRAVEARRVVGARAPAAAGDARGGPVCACVCQRGPLSRRGRGQTSESIGSSTSTWPSSPLSPRQTRPERDGRSRVGPAGHTRPPRHKAPALRHRPLLPRTRRFPRLRPLVRPPPPPLQAPRLTPVHTAWARPASSRQSAPATSTALWLSRSLASQTPRSRSSTSTAASRVRPARSLAPHPS